MTLAEKALAALDLDRVLWVVTARPPHKPGAPVTPVSTSGVRLRAVASGSAVSRVRRSCVVMMAVTPASRSAAAKA